MTGDWSDDITDALLKDDLQHCLAGKPGDRFAGAAQLAKHLRALPERRAALQRQQAEKARILDEFVDITGYHRKHAMRLLRSHDGARRSRRARRRVYEEAERNALTLLWEASDRVCGKRLKALMPSLIEAMERHDEP